MANPTVQPHLKCTVISCPNYFDTSPQLCFFDFPDDEEIKSKWKEKCGIAANHNTSRARVCSAHFKPAQYINKRKLKPDAIPIENLGWMVGESLAPLPGVPAIQTVIPMEQIVKSEPRPEPPKPSFSAIKVVADENYRLHEYLGRLKAEEEDVKAKQKNYENKIVSTVNEINKLNLKIKRITRRRKRDGVVETNLISKVFSQAQINFLMGVKKVVWSPDDMAMAFTLRHLGNKECYLYLKDTLNMPLPSLSCIQRWFASNEP